MKRILRDQALVYEIDHRLPPLIEVDPGEVFEVETEDAASGRLRDAATLPTPENRPELLASPPRVNPVAGPVYIRGVEPGDCVAVTIHNIDVDTQGFTSLRPGFGPFSDSRKWMGDTDSYTHILTHHPGPSGTLADGRVRFNEKLGWPLRPFIGTLATAPEREVPTSGFGQGAFGGNLDVRDYAPGSVVLLNAYHPGALLFAGDVHGSQADTEFTGTANEVRSLLRLSCQIIKDRRLPAPRILKEKTIVFLGIDKPLEIAVKKAMTAFMEWLVDEHGVSPREAYLMTSVHPEVRVHVYQMIPGASLNYVAGVEFPHSGPDVT